MRTRTRSRSALPIAFIAVLSLAWIHCSGEESTAPEPEPAAESPVAEERASDEEGLSADEELIFSDDALPPGFPADVPTYPGAQNGPSFQSPGLGVFATFISDDEVADIVDHYRDQLAERGWSVDVVYEYGVDASKNGRLSEIRAKANEESGQTEIAISVEEK